MSNWLPQWWSKRETASQSGKAPRRTRTPWQNKPRLLLEPLEARLLLASSVLNPNGATANGPPLTGNNPSASGSLVNFQDFSTTTGLTLNGSTTAADNVLRLTTADYGQAGSAFFNTPIALNQAFSTHFQLNLHDATSGIPADGVTFTIQNSSSQNFNTALSSGENPASHFQSTNSTGSGGPGALGSGGGSLGYGGITPSVAVEFDTFDNGDIDGNSANHVAILTNGNIVNVNDINPTDPGFPLYGNGPVNVWVDYHPATTTLDVFLCQTTTKPANPLISYNYDLTANVGSTAYFGFTGGTGGANSIQDIQNWQVTGLGSAALSPVATFPVAANEASLASGELLLFKSAADSPEAHLSTAQDFAATIDWGDNTTSTGFVQYDSNRSDVVAYTVGGAHIYNEQRDGGYSLNVGISVDGGAPVTLSAGTAAIGEAPLATAGYDLGNAPGLTEGTSFTATVAHFIDSDPNGTASDFSATIDWGDGQTSAGNVIPTRPSVFGEGFRNSFDVQGSHAFRDDVVHAVTVTISDLEGDSQTYTVSGGVTIADRSLTSATGQTISVTENQPQAVTVATFADANPLAQAGDFTATIFWGDGASSLATSIQANNGGFDVAGSHSYAREGDYSTTIQIAEKAGGTTPLTASGLIVVLPSAAPTFQAATVPTGTVGSADRPVVTVSAPASTNNSSQAAAPQVTVSVQQVVNNSGNPVTVSMAVLTGIQPPPGTNSTGTVATAPVFLDLRAPGLSADSTLTCSITIPIPPGVPLDDAELNAIKSSIFFFETGVGWIQVVGSAAHPILATPDGHGNVVVTWTFDDATHPKVTELNGTIFAVNVPVGTQSSTSLATSVAQAPTLRATTDTGPSLSQAATFQTNTQITLTLTSAQGSQLSATQTGLSGSAASGGLSVASTGFSTLPGSASAAGSSGAAERSGGFGDDLWDNNGDDDMFWWWLRVAQRDAGPQVVPAATKLSAEASTPVCALPLDHAALDSIFGTLAPLPAEAEALAVPQIDDLGRVQPATWDRGMATRPQLPLVDGHCILAALLVGVALPVKPQDRRSGRRRRQGHCND